MRDPAGASVASFPPDASAKGSANAFDANWRTRHEAKYNHWTAGSPRNQIQLAFRSHWTLFSEYFLKGRAPGRCLEVGCGRGSISSYFAGHGWDVTLLDYSTSVLRTAQDIYASNKHPAHFLDGDAFRLPLKNETYDVVVSIGLLEHFEDVRSIMAEQVRILKPGGVFLGYVVPENPQGVNRYFNWINAALGAFHRLFLGGKSKAPKPEVYRSGLSSEGYLEALEGLPLGDLRSFGMYPMPMISHSIAFPFSLMHPLLEVPLTWTYRLILGVRRLFLGRHPWECSESLGQAFLVAGVRQ